MNNLIFEDVTRCHGEKLTATSPCYNCARRLQIALDDKDEYYPTMVIEPIKGSCVYKIKVTEV